MHPETPDSPEAAPPRRVIRRSPAKRPVLDASLALASEGVRHWIEFSGEDFLLTVEAADAARAASLLESYEAENEGYRAEDPEVAPFDLHVSPALHLAIPTLFSFWATRETWGRWMETRGAAIAGRILGEGAYDVEWWRVLTATTLHADSEHYLGNMLSGYFIFNLLRRRCGIGTSMLLLTLAAAVANWGVAMLSPPYYRSIGFSTVVFAGLGLLAAVETRFFPRGLRPGLRNFTPLLGAFFLAVMTGLGENADVKAHFIGFACGALCAPAVFWLKRKGFETTRRQTAAVLATYAVYAVAWWAALG